MARIFLGFLGFVLLAGCSQAVVSKVVVRDMRPTLAFVNAPEGAVVAVDGLPAGRADLYDGKPQVLFVEPGTHRVTVTTAANEKVYEETIFVDSEHKVINVH